MNTIKNNMTRELAERILQLQINEQKLVLEKHELRKLMGYIAWNNVCIEAAKFLLGKDRRED